MSPFWPANASFHAKGKTQSPDLPAHQVGESSRATKNHDGGRADSVGDHAYESPMMSPSSNLTGYFNLQGASSKKGQEQPYDPGYPGFRPVNKRLLGILYEPESCQKIPGLVPSRPPATMKHHPLPSGGKNRDPDINMTDAPLYDGSNHFLPASSDPWPRLAYSNTAHHPQTLPRSTSQPIYNPSFPPWGHSRPSTPPRGPAPCVDRNAVTPSFENSLYNPTSVGSSSSSQSAQYGAGLAPGSDMTYSSATLSTPAMAPQTQYSGCSGGFMQSPSPFPDASHTIHQKPAPSQKILSYVYQVLPSMPFQPFPQTEHSFRGDWRCRFEYIC